MSQESSIETYRAGARTGAPSATIPITATLITPLSSTAAPHVTAPVPLLRQIRARLAFERTSTRLYEAVLGQLDASPRSTPGSRRDGLDRQTLLRFRNEEAAHFELLCEALESLGTDALAEMDALGTDTVRATGAVSPNDAAIDPLAGLDALLDAEQTDEIGWHRLVATAHAYGMDELAQRFEQAHAEEIGHVRQLQAWRAALPVAWRRVA